MLCLRLLLGFFGLGLALLAGDRLVASIRAGSAPIAVQDERAAARAEALGMLGRPPSAEELEALTRARVDDELLYREALARGLDREDRGVRRRLARNVAFLDGQADAPPTREREEALYREALALGMDRSDTVVRRKLIQRARLEIELEGRGAEPSEAELRAWLEAHPESGALPTRAAFRHLFFDPARRGRRAEQDARQALALLARGAEPAADACFLPAEQPLQSARFVERLLGPAFAAAVFDAPLGRWTGPLRSSLGWHLVMLREREPAGPQQLSSARAEARDAILAARGAAALERFLAERR